MVHIIIYYMEIAIVPINFDRRNVFFNNES